MVARIDGYKGHRDLLQALALLKDKGPPVLTLIIGDGTERAAMEAMADSLALHEFVRFLGYRSDIVDILAAADCFVLPSLSEGLPMSVLEAMAAGLPSVVTPVGGVPELVVHGENGIHVPVHDPSALAGAITDLALSAPLRDRLGCAARARVVSHFSFSEMAGKYAQLYRNLVESWNQLKALLFTHLYPTAAHPTRGLFNAHVFNAIGRYCDARVVVAEPWWAQRPRERVDRFSGIETHYAAYGAFPGFLDLRAAAQYAGVRDPIRRLHRDFPFDAILSAWAYPDAVAAAALAREFHCPLVVNVLGSDINVLSERPALRGQIQEALGQAASVVAVSAALADRVVNLGIPPERVVVQHNGVDGDRFILQDRALLRDRLGLPKASPVIAYVGRLSLEKGVDILLDATRLLQSTHPNVGIILAGGGKLERSLRRQARQLGIDDCVRFLGDQPSSAIPGWIGASDLLCLPSRREGCPNVVLEALACGVPVVAARVGGLPELIAEDNGILVAPESAASLAKGLHAALDRTWQPTSLRASVPHLSWDHVGRRYADRLASAIAPRRAALRSHGSAQN
jgi:glycosyltransferase involved in cell wall biosynthesis